MTQAAPAPAAAAVNPYATLALGGASVVTDIIGLIMQKNAMDRARRDAQRIDAREVEYRAGRDAVTDRFTKESLKLSKDKAKLDKALAMHGLNQDKISQIEKMFNTNTALQDRALNMWSR
jgi:hypothetical protein